MVTNFALIWLMANCYVYQAESTTVTQREKITYVLNYTVTVRPPNAAPINTTIHIWLDTTASFLVVEELPGAGRIFTYYDGTTINRCTKSADDDTAKNKTKALLGKIQKETDRHKLAIAYGTSIFPCLVDPSITTPLFRHCPDQSVLFGGASYSSSDKNKLRAYSSKYVFAAYRLDVGVLETLHYKKDAFDLSAGLLDEKPTPAKEGETIKQKARSIFGEELGEKYIAEDVTEVVLKMQKPK